MYEGQLLHTCDKNLIHKNEEDDDNEGGLFGGEKHDDSGHETAPNSVLNFLDSSAQKGEDAFSPTITLWKARMCVGAKPLSRNTSIGMSDAPLLYV